MTQNKKTNSAQQVPTDFVCCTQSGCTAAATCLRHCALASLPETRTTVLSLNPKQARPTDGTACPHYLKAELVEQVRGFKRALATVPSGKVNEVAAAITRRYSQASFYRMRNGKIAMRGKTRQFIENLLLKNGAQSPITFDATEQSFPYDDTWA